MEVLREVTNHPKCYMLCEKCYGRSKRCKVLCQDCRERKRKIAKMIYEKANNGIRQISVRAKEIYSQKIQAGEPRSRELFNQSLREASKENKIKN